MRQPTLRFTRPELSAHVGESLLGIDFDRGRWLRWRLKNRCDLTHH